MTFLIYTEPKDDCLEIWKHCKKIYPEHMWDECTNIEQLKEKIESKNIVFMDGGYIGTDKIMQTDIITTIDRYVEDMVDNNPNIEFVITGGLASHWYKKLGWSEKHNMDFVAISGLMNYLERKLNF